MTTILILVGIVLLFNAVVFALLFRRYFRESAIDRQFASIVAHLADIDTP